VRTRHFLKPEREQAILPTALPILRHVTSPSFTFTSSGFTLPASPFPHGKNRIEISSISIGVGIGIGCIGVHCPDFGKVDAR
jgi:hypothetical protein